MAGANRDMRLAQAMSRANQGVRAAGRRICDLAGLVARA